jgi:hypothetical protein
MAQAAFLVFLTAGYWIAERVVVRRSLESVVAICR